MIGEKWGGGGGKPVFCFFARLKSMTRVGHREIVL